MEEISNIEDIMPRHSYIRSIAAIFPLTNRFVYQKYSTLAIKVPHLVVAKSPGCLGATKSKDKLTPTRCSELVVDVLEAKCHYCSAMPAIWPIWAQISTAKADRVEQKRWSCEVVGGHQFSKKRFSFVLGKIWLLWLLIWHFVASGHIMASGMFFKFGTSHHVAADLLVLGATLVVHMGRFGHLFLGKSGANSTGLCLRENQQWFFDKYRAVENLFVFGAALVLPLARVPLLKLQERGATTVLPSCACHLAHLSTKISTAKAAPVQQSQFGTATG